MIRILAVLAGFVSLGSEVAFTRSAELLLGNTNATMAVVLASYLGGLAVGSLVAGRSVLVQTRPAWAFALAELVLAVAVFAAARLLPLVAFVPAPQDAAILSSRALATLPLLLPPALAAGFAFPALVVLLDRGREQPGGESVGGIYGFETLGAVIGALFAGFVLYREVGLACTYALLSCGALVAAGLCLASGRTLPRPPVTRAAAATLKSDGTRTLVALLLAGAAIVGLELLWTRLLLFFIPGLISALAAVLAGILFGTAIGATAGGLLSRAGAGRRAAARFLLVGALGVALSLAILPYLADVIRWFPRPRGGGYQPGFEMLAGFAAAALLAAVPTACSGAALPLVVQSLARGPRVGSARAYSWSSFGSVLGVLVAAPAAGVLLEVRECVVVAGFLLAAAGLWLWRPRKDGLVEPILGLAAAAALLLAPLAEPMLRHSVEFRKTYTRGRTIIATDQDAHVIASVVDMGPGQGRALYTNSFQAASTGRFYGYMRMLGHLPVFLAVDPARVLVIAYGTGTTVGSVALHSAVRSIEIAELSPAVMRLAPYFDEVNHGVPHLTSRGKDVAVWYGDGRALVEAHGESWDVITLEPLPPNTPAAVHFYTSEFYGRCADRLTPGGVLCQWIPMHSASLAGFKVLARTFADQFETTWLFLFDQCVLLVGSVEPGRSMVARLVVERAATPEVAADLFRANMEGTAAVLASFVAGRRVLMDATAGSEVMTDDRPSVALDLARPDITAVDNSRANAEFLHSIREDVTRYVLLDGLEATDRDEFLSKLGRAAGAKRLLLEARFRPERAGFLLERALVLAPGDLEALDRLGKKPAAPSAPAAGRERIESVLGSEQPDRRQLEQAIDLAGTSEEVDAALLLPYLNHADIELRVRAMVALERRMWDLGSYDPAAPAAARQRVIATVRERLRR